VGGSVDQGRGTDGWANAMGGSVDQLRRGWSLGRLGRVGWLSRTWASGCRWDGGTGGGWDASEGVAQVIDRWVYISLLLIKSARVVCRSAVLPFCHSVISIVRFTVLRS
jgi:hypothetical protein